MNEILNYKEYAIINECYNIELVYESFSITEKINKIKDLLVKFNNINSIKIKKIILNTLILLTAGVIGYNINNFVNISELSNKLLKNKTELTFDQLKDSIQNNQYNDSTFKNPLLFKTSDNGKNHIKEQEYLVLKAKDIGDGKITIGYGHSEYASTSKYQIGDTITEDEANELFETDLIIREQAIKRMFKEWKNEGVDIKISQNMFDVLVSLVYNSGTRKLRNTEFIDLLKNKKFQEAGLKIKDTLNRNSNKFPGLITRRNKESEMFLASL